MLGCGSYQLLWTVKLFSCIRVEALLVTVSCSDCSGWGFLKFKERLSASQRIRWIYSPTHWDRGKETRRGTCMYVSVKQVKSQAKKDRLFLRPLCPKYYFRSSKQWTPFSKLSQTSLCSFTKFWDLESDEIPPFQSHSRSAGAHSTSKIINFPLN